MTEKKIHMELYALRDIGGGVMTCVVNHDMIRIGMLGVDPDNKVHLFEGPARELQAWAAKRNIPYQHVTLHVPIELEI